MTGTSGGTKKKSAKGRTVGKEKNCVCMTRKQQEEE
jgi:hypothetical protein